MERHPTTMVCIPARRNPMYICKYPTQEASWWSFSKPPCMTQDGVGDSAGAGGRFIHTKTTRRLFTHTRVSRAAAPSSRAPRDASDADDDDARDGVVNDGDDDARDRRRQNAKFFSLVSGASASRRRLASTRGEATVQTFPSDSIRCVSFPDGSGRGSRGIRTNSRETPRFSRRRRRHYRDERRSLDRA